jgi:acetolactate synthase-1/2/3 large subunit
MVIGKGGNFVSYTGRFIETTRPGCWMDPGLFGCLGRRSRQTIGAPRPPGASYAAESRTRRR